MKVVAIVQARMGSSRLPGKILKKLGSITVLEFLLKRLSKSKTVDEIVVATTTDKKDDQIAELINNTRFNIFRGSEDDVLERYIGASEEYKADIIVRITSDCPFVDPILVDDCVKEILDKDLDYVSNCNEVKHLLPDGFDVEVFSRKSLLLAQKLSITKSFKEHVTFAFFKTGLFSIGSIDYKKDYSHLRVTLDYEEDYLVISAIANEMGKNFWGWKQITEFLLNNKSIAATNQDIIRNASWELSLEKDSKKNVETRESYIANSSGLLSKRADQFSPEMWPKNYIQAKGQVIWTDNKKLYLDYSIGGIGATTLGYACDSIDDAVIESIRNASATSLNSYLELEASKKLMNAIPWIQSLRYTRSGGEAATLAVRLARAFTNKSGILFSGYHGWHDWYLAGAIKHKLGNHLLDFLPIAGVPKELADTVAPFDYGNAEDFLGKLDKNTGVVILEPMRYDEPDIEFLQLVRSECDKRNIVLIFDEISCGFRFNNNAVHLDINIIPDIVVFSKSIGNGYPIACVGGKEEFMNSVKNTFISSTTHTEAVGFAAMGAVLDYFDQNDVANGLAERGKAIREILIKSAKKANLNISYKGLDQLWSWRFDVDDDLNRSLQTLVTEGMLEKSILFSNRVYATLGIDPDLLCLFERALDETFKKIRSILDDSQDPNDYIKFGLNKLGIY